MDKNAADADGAGGVNDALCCVQEQGAAEAMSLIGTVHSEAGKDHNRNRIGHVPPEAPGRRGNHDGARRKRVEGDDPPVGAYHKRAGRPARLIGERAAPQPVVEREGAGVERVDTMVIGERFGR